MKIDKAVKKRASILSKKHGHRVFVSRDYLGPSFQKNFLPGVDKVYYALAVYDKKEIEAVVRALEKGWLGLGEYSTEFAKRIAKLFGKKYGILVNSGSSATFLALKILDLPPASEVITPACTFATTFAAIINNNLVPVVADSELGSYNLKLSHLSKMISRKTKAILIPHTIGNLNDMKRLHVFARKHKLYLIEDSCDTVGGKIYGKPTGTFADITVSSFYASHHITAAGGGGAICVDDEKFLARAIAYRDWGRFGDDNEDVRERFSYTIDGIPYDRKFIYSVPGYNLKPVEIQSAFGLVQLSKLRTFNKQRRENFKRLYNFFQKYENFFILPKEHPNAEVYWLAFPLTIRDSASFTRLELLTFLEQNHIQTRLLFTGNVLRHPAFKKVPYRVVGELLNADKIMKDTFLIGCHHGLTDKMLQYVFLKFQDFLKQY